MPQNTDRFFIATPVPTSKTKTDKNNKTFPVYLNEQGKPQMWSGEFPLPAIGTRVFIKMNNIGWALVKGYFESYGYLGLMTLPLDPPAWLREQQVDARKDPACPDWMQEGLGCEFGSEVSLKAPDSAGAASHKRNQRRIRPREHKSNNS